MRGDALTKKNWFLVRVPLEIVLYKCKALSIIRVRSPIDRRGVVLSWACSSLPRITRGGFCSYQVVDPIVFSPSLSHAILDFAERLSPLYRPRSLYCSFWTSRGNFYDTKGLSVDCPSSCSALNTKTREDAKVHESGPCSIPSHPKPPKLRYRRGASLRVNEGAASADVSNLAKATPSYTHTLKKRGALRETARKDALFFPDYVFILLGPGQGETTPNHPHKPPRWGETRKSLRVIFIVIEPHDPRNSFTSLWGSNSLQRQA